MVFKITYTYFGSHRAHRFTPSNYFEALTIANHLRASTGTANVNILPMGVTL
jgi:hypothetical protein